MSFRKRPKPTAKIHSIAVITTMTLLFGTIPSRPLYAEETLQEITVPSGETLWSISNKYLKDPKRWSEIVKYNPNAGADPTLPIPGKKLKIPIGLIKEEYQNAQLVKAIPNVEYKRKNTPEWKSAKVDMMFNYDDSVRTLQGGQAHVKLPTKEIIQIDENSYVVLRPEKILQEIQLVRGDVRASRAKVITPRGTVVKPLGTKSDFKAKVREDETEVIFVYKGKVDVTAKGKTVTVLEGYGTEVPKSAGPLDPVPLPELKDFNPADITTITPDFPSNDAPKSAIEIKTPKPVEESPREGRAKSVVSQNILVNYRLQLSVEPDFKNIILEKTESIGTGLDLKKQSIPDGTYYMRVAFLDSLGGQGPFSSPSRVTKDSLPPELKNLTPSEGQKFMKEESYCDVVGDIMGASLVSVNGEVVFVSPEGRFSKFMTLKPGENKIKILARDSQGNETNVERKVFYTP